MHIICPNCGFSAEVDPGKLSPKAAVANCPQCRHRFRFRQFDQDDQRPEQSRDGGLSKSQPGISPDADSFAEQSGAGPGDSSARDVPSSSYGRPPLDSNDADYPQSPGSLPGEPPKDIWDELDSEHRPNLDDSSGSNEGRGYRGGWRDNRRLDGGRDAYGRGPDSPGEDSRGDSRGGFRSGGGYDNRGRAQEPWGQRSGNAVGQGNNSGSWRGRLGLEGGNFRDIPWEHPEKYGYANGFFETCKRVLLAPMRFFGEMSPTASIWPKLTFACFWKFFDLILTFIYRPDLLQKLLTQTEIPLHEGNMKVTVVIVAMFLITLVMLGMFLLGALICRLCATIVLRRSVDFQTCLAIVCYPNVLLIFSVLPFSFLTLPLTIAMAVFNGLALFKGLKLNNIEFIKVFLLLLLSGVALGAVLAVLISLMLG